MRNATVNRGENVKVGILTHYYKSINYGGNLQAYALVEILKKLNYCSMQISYKKNRKITVRLFLSICKRLLSVTNYKILYRNYKIRKFNKSVPHTQVYDEHTINSIKEDFDILITGSDQVWHPQAVCDAYLLNFKTNAIKMSYAASFSVDEIKDNNKYESALEDFSAISVREKQALNILESIGIRNGTWVLDPTLLLEFSEWNSMCPKRKIKCNYLFCYFLGNDTVERELAKEFAKKNNLKIVTLPNLLGTKRICDNKFGDYKLYDVDPKALLSLIKHAEYVFTDSFHATVFSHLFQKQYFVFGRTDLAGMESRISSLLDLFRTRNRFCNTKCSQSLAYIEELSDIDYNQELTEFENMKKKSIYFLMDSIKKAEELKN